MRNFDALLAATHDDGQHNAVLTVSPGNTVRLQGVSTMEVGMHPGVFDTGAPGSA